MKRLTVLLAALVMALYLAGVPALAQHGHGGSPGGRPGGPPGSPPGPRNNPGQPGTPGNDRGSRPESSRNSSTETGKKKTVSELLAQNTKLASKLQALLPEGTDLQQAASGFKNLGQFVAAAHVSHNLNIPFDQLKATMIGPPSKSLGQAIHELNPNVDAKAEAKKANKQAKADTKESSS